MSDAGGIIATIPCASENLASDKQETTTKCEGPSEIRNGGPLEYVCATDALFVKRMKSPTDSCKITKVKRRSGSLVHATGALWTGKFGGVWAEMEESLGKRGWALVEGQGFGLPGPALIETSVAEKQYLAVQVVLLQEDALNTGTVYEMLIDKDAKVQTLKTHMCSATGLTLHHCCLSKELPPKLENGVRAGIDYMPEMKDERTLISYNFDGFAQIFLVYVGDVPPNLRVRQISIPSLG